MYCQQCGKPMPGRRSDARYCGGSCRSRASRERSQKRTQAQRTPPLAQSLTGSLQSAAERLQFSPADHAALQLAHKYASMIDGSDELEVLDKLGPKLLAVLDALGATPRGRGMARRPEPGQPPKPATPAPAPPTALQALRDARAATAGK